jgi:cysteine sulfinate desulfinase/cysteine desulfurase-like protein
MGLSAAQAQESLRFSLSATCSPSEVDAVVAALVEQVPRAREAGCALAR